jgi:hypothetical protein
MVGKVIVQPATDTTGPLTSNVAVTPNPTGGAASVTITGDVSDVAFGGSNVAAAEYFIDSLGSAGTGVTMDAADGTLNAPLEGIVATASVTGLTPGTHQVFVQGRDSAGNWGDPSVAALTIGVGAGLSLTAQPVSFGNVTITGDAQSVTASPSPWRASDGRGSSDGWHVTIQATDFVSASRTIAIGNLKVQVMQSSITTVSGNAPPVSVVISYQPVSPSPMKLITAAPGSGAGTYEFTPGFQLTLPASAYAGAYATALTTSVNSGP